MSSEDIAIKNTLLHYSIPILFMVFSVLLYITDNTRYFKKWLFKRLLLDYMSLYSERTCSVRKALFENLDSVESRVKLLKNRGVIRLLEIGIGNGTNLKHYPQQTHIIVVDPSLTFKQYYKENSNLFPDVYLEDYVLSSAESFPQVESRSVDVVVTTTLLCSVKNVDVVLKEIRRVLVPGGKYYFLEHVLDAKSTKRYKLQMLLSWTGLWQMVFECQFLELESAIKNAGFSQVELEKFNIVDAHSRLMYLVAPHITGIATN